MKGIIQMTILEPLVHLYQKLRRCCRHNNIKICFCSFVLLAGLGRNFFPSQFHSFVVANSSSSHRDMWGDTQTIQQTTPVGSRDSQLKGNVGNLDRKEEKHPTHDTECAACLIKWLCNYTHQGTVFLSQPIADPQGWHLRCEKDIHLINIKKIISQANSCHKETGQPSQRDWMSPLMLGL